MLILMAAFSLASEQERKPPPPAPAVERDPLPVLLPDQLNLLSYTSCP